MILGYDTAWTSSYWKAKLSFFLTNDQHGGKTWNPNYKSGVDFLIFLMAMDANYSFELIFIKTYVPQFIGLNKSFLGSVLWYNKF